MVVGEGDFLFKVHAPFAQHLKQTGIAYTLTTHSKVGRDLGKLTALSGAEMIAICPGRCSEPGNCFRRSRCYTPGSFSVVELAMPGVGGSCATASGCRPGNEAGLFGRHRGGWRVFEEPVGPGDEVFHV